MARYDYLQAVMADGRMLFDIAGGPGDDPKNPEQWVTINADTVHFFYVFSGKTDDHAAPEEQAFARHNRDDRPRGKEIRSMSVGDVLVIRGENDLTAPRVLVCRNFGWTEIRWTAGNSTFDRLESAAARKAHTHLSLTDLVNALNHAATMRSLEEAR